MKKRTRRLLVANRGEIACRIFRTCHEMGIATVAVYSDPDRHAVHATAADIAIPLGGRTSAESYLDMAKILAAAALAEADAIHPGYGFLSENAEFATACTEAGLTWIGPTPHAIRSMALKIEAKRLVGTAGVPLLGGATIEGDDHEEWTRRATEVGFPLLVKASAGGGGKGMREVRGVTELAEAIATARREAASSFGDPTVFIERLLERPRHVEVQVLGDHDGNIVHLFERDCSIQRRHQKVVEEAPAPSLSKVVRERLHTAAVAAAQAIGYTNAGTVEFLVSGDDAYFLEMNTRLQVEHPVTEAITGLDLVRLQIEIASGAPLPFTQADVEANGHSIEVRLYAENPRHGFLPSVGTLDTFETAGDGVRWDSGVASSSVISPYYDPMLAKVIAHGRTRDDAAFKLASALRSLRVHGVDTNRDLLVAVLEHDDFLDAKVHTSFLDEHPLVLQSEAPELTTHMHLAAASLSRLSQARRSSRLPGVAAPGWRNLQSEPVEDRFTARGETVGVRVMGGTWEDVSTTLTIDGVDYGCTVIEATPKRVDVEIAGRRVACATNWIGDRCYVNGAGWQSDFTLEPRFPVAIGDAASRGPTAPVPGTVVVVNVRLGDVVEAGHLLVVIEAMKMEHRVVAPHGGTIAALHVELHGSVDAHQVLVEITPVDEP